MVNRAIHSLLLAFLLATSCAADATLPDGCEMPKNDGNLSTWMSLEVVCVRAGCLNVQAQESVAREKLQTIEVSPGGQLLEDFLMGDTSGDFEGYLYTVGSLVIPGLIATILTCCCGSICCCQRLCCTESTTCLGCRFTPSAAKPYSPTRRLMSSVAYTIVAVLLVICAITGMTAGSGKFANSFVRASCTIDTVNVRTNGFIEGIIDPITTLDSEFKNVVAEVTRSLGDTTEITNAMTFMATKFTQLSATADSYQDATDCIRERAVSEAATQAAQATQKSAETFNTDLNDVKKDIEKNLIDSQADIQESTKESKVLFDVV